MTKNDRLTALEAQTARIDIQLSRSIDRAWTTQEQVDRFSDKRRWSMEEIWAFIAFVCAAPVCLSIAYAILYAAWA